MHRLISSIQWRFRAKQTTLTLSHTQGTAAYAKHMTTNENKNDAQIYCYCCPNFFFLKSAFETSSQWNVRASEYLRITDVCAAHSCKMCNWTLARSSTYTFHGYSRHHNIYRANFVVVFSSNSISFSILFIHSLSCERSFIPKILEPKILWCDFPSQLYDSLKMLNLCAPFVLKWEKIKKWCTGSKSRVAFNSNRFALLLLSIFALRFH